MLWQEINSDHHLRKAAVSSKSTKKHPETGETYIGVIVCEKDGYVPILKDGEIAHSFSGGWEVNLEEEGLIDV